MCFDLEAHSFSTKGTTMITAIAAFFARQSLKSFIGMSLEFILTHWKILLLAAVLIYTHVKFYNAGFDSADSHWIKQNNRQVKVLNDKIKRIENDSSAEAKALRAKATELEARLATLTASFPTIVAHDASGQVLKCEGKEVVPYLGPDFTESWNRLNKAGELK